MLIKYSIIILNYNWKEFNKNCIDSLLLQTFKNFEIIFVDQCSIDWSLEEVENLYEKEIKNWKIKIVKNSENNWFTWWNNLGVKYADKDSKYICLLNNDTIVPKDWLEKLVQSIEKDDWLWAVSCLILDKWYEDKIRNQVFNNKKKCISSIFWESIYVDMDKEEINSKFYYTSFLCWCCFLYKRDLIKEPFPQYYFAYAEDVFLSWNIMNMWYKLWVCLDTYISHYWSWSFWTKPSQLKLFHWNKNQIINFLVFYPVFYKILLFPVFLVKEIAHLFMWAPMMRVNAKLKWWWWILKNYNLIITLRVFVKKNRAISSFDFYKQLSFKLSDSYYFDRKILKLLVNIWNIFFIMYCSILEVLFYIYNLFYK